MRPVLLHVWSTWECPPIWSPAASLAILAQRLVRVICSKCKQPYAPTERDLEAAGITPEQAASANFMKGRGCNHCGKQRLPGPVGHF